MNQKRFLLILCFALTSFCLSSVSAQVQQSLNYGTYTDNGTYHTNLRVLLSSLPSNVTAHNTFFYNASIGQKPDQVFAIGMCIPGSSSKDCSDCIKTSSDGLLQILHNQVAAYSWRSEPTLCHVRYSNAYFLGSIDLEPRDLVDNTGDINSNVTDFVEKRRELVIRMIGAASRAKRGVSSSDNHFTADVEALNDFENIYGLMQCSPYLSSSDCETCLQYQSCCGQKQGGVIVRPDCYFRWDVVKFSKAFDNITLQPGGRANSRDNSKSLQSYAKAFKLLEDLFDCFIK